jgi:hypothetical protein
VNCTAHKPQILMGLPAILASNPVGCGGLQPSERTLNSLLLHHPTESSSAGKTWVQCAPEVDWAHESGGTRPNSGCCQRRSEFPCQPIARMFPN